MISDCCVTSCASASIVADPVVVVGGVIAGCVVVVVDCDRRWLLDGCSIGVDRDCLKEPAFRKRRRWPSGVAASACL